MPGTRAGAAKTKIKNLERNPNFYREIGHIGGSRGTTGGFAANVSCDCDLISGAHAKRQCAGKKGGLRSRRGIAKNNQGSR